MLRSNLQRFLSKDLSWLKEWDQRGGGLRTRMVSAEGKASPSNSNYVTTLRAPIGIYIVNSAMVSSVAATGVPSVASPGIPSATRHGFQEGGIHLHNYSTHGPMGRLVDHQADDGGLLCRVPGVHVGRIKFHIIGIHVEK